MNGVAPASCVTSQSAVFLVDSGDSYMLTPSRVPNETCPACGLGISTGKGSAGEGSAGEGAPGEGAAGEGSAGEGAPGEGAAGEGAPGEGAPGDGAAGAEPSDTAWSVGPGGNPETLRGETGQSLCGACSNARGGLRTAAGAVLLCCCNGDGLREWQLAHADGLEERGSPGPSWPPPGACSAFGPAGTGSSTTSCISTSASTGGFTGVAVMACAGRTGGVLETK